MGETGTAKEKPRRYDIDKSMSSHLNASLYDVIDTIMNLNKGEDVAITLKMEGD